MSQHKNMIKKCAKLCELSYKDSFHYQELGYLSQKLIDVKNTQVHVLYDQLYTYVVFRGTEPDKLQDWASDLDFRFDRKIKGYGVHKGFLQYVMNAYDDIMAELDKSHYNGKSLIITGHSLGGAAAVIFAEKMTRTVEKVVTFGQPRVGDKRMCESNGLNDILIRVVNENDPVTLLPPSFRGYRFWGTCLYFTLKGQIRTCPSLFKRWWGFFIKPKGRFLTKNLKNHSMELYYKNATHLQ